MMLRLCLLSVVLTMIGCQVVKDRGQTVASPGVETGRAQQMLGPIVGSEKIMSDMRAAGFSVGDPKVRWGVTIYVDATQPSGGFRGDAQEKVITLHWEKVPDARSYEIFRSTGPMIPLMMETTLTMDAGGNSLDTDNHWADNQVAAGTVYYYFVLAITKNRGCSVVATGSAEASAPVSITSQPAGSDEAQREALRRRDGVKRVNFFEEGQASNVPNGRYGFDNALSTDGLNLLYRNDGEHHDHFEIHKLADGRYSLIGYVSSEVAEKLKEPTDGMRFSIYSHRWTAATEFVCIPAEHLAHSEWLVGEVITLDGNRRPDRILGNSNRVIEAVWK
jgi:hypothetical protein